MLNTLYKITKLIKNCNSNVSLSGLLQHTDISLFFLFYWSMFSLKKKKMVSSIRSRNTSNSAPAYTPKWTGTTKMLCLSVYMEASSSEQFVPGFLTWSHKCPKGISSPSSCSVNPTWHLNRLNPIWLSAGKRNFDNVERASISITIYLKKQKQKQK